jgi:putative transposase
MVRIARIVVPKYAYHVTQRGNYKQKTFESREDYVKYLTWMKEYQDKYKLDILAYCLMPNHVHFICIPQQESSLAKTFNICHMRYSQYFNKKRHVKGHLWQGRFFSCVLDQEYLYAAIKYVERNPLKAGIVKNIDDWEWSSAREHLKKDSQENKLIQLKDINEFLKINNWRDYLESESNEEKEKQIKKYTLTGRPLGDNNFIEKLEKQTGKVLRVEKVGRPRKNSRCP